MYSQGESESLLVAPSAEAASASCSRPRWGIGSLAQRTLIAKVKQLVRPLIKALGLRRAQLPRPWRRTHTDFSPRYLQRAVEESLKRLRTDRMISSSCTVRRAT